VIPRSVLAEPTLRNESNYFSPSMSDNPIVETLSKIPVRTNVLTLAAVVVGSVILYSRIARWEATLESLKQDCWRIEDHIEFTHELKESNPALIVPDSGKIVRHRKEMHTSQMEEKGNPE
jgi:hypothetical protein